jgi:CheY-like chemotaxis protein
MSTKVLVIEDNEQNLYLVTYLLARHGLEILGARTGPQGLAIAAHVRPDLILLDIQLPGMDGYEIARQLITIATSRGVPIVAVTSYAMEGDRERGMAAGCVGYIEKPINPETFLEEIRPFLPPGWTSELAG